MTTRHSLLKTLSVAAASVRDVYASVQRGGPDDTNPRLNDAKNNGVLWLNDVKTMVNGLYDQFEEDGPPLPMNLEDEINELRPIVTIDGDDYVKAADVKTLLKDLAPSLFEED